VLRYDGEEVLFGAKPSMKKSSFRFSFRSSTRRLSRRLPRKTIKLAIVECERLDGTFETSLYVFSLNPRALFPAFIAVLSKYHANKTSNWIIQFSRFDLKKTEKYRLLVGPIFFLPFFGFKTKSEKPKNDC
jgi:hypothetical protein